MLDVRAHVLNGTHAVHDQAHALNLGADTIHAMAQACAHAFHATPSLPPTPPNVVNAGAHPLNSRDTASASTSSLLCNDLSSLQGIT